MFRCFTLVALSIVIAIPAIAQYSDNQDEFCKNLKQLMYVGAAEDFGNYMGSETEFSTTDVAAFETDLSLPGAVRNEVQDMSFFKQFYSVFTADTMLTKKHTSVFLEVTKKVEQCLVKEEWEIIEQEEGPDFFAVKQKVYSLLDESSPCAIYVTVENHDGNKYLVTLTIF